MEEIVQMLPLELLYPHPRQHEIYGEIDADPDFIASVQEKGIITPLIVTQTDTGYMIISGHRRHHAAGIAGLAEVPCLVRSYKSDDEMELVFLVSNQFREKNLQQRINEFLALKPRLRKLGKCFLNDADKASLNLAFLNQKSDVVDASIMELLKDFKVDLEKPINSTEIIARETGLTSYFQGRVTFLFDDDYLGGVQARLEKSGMKPKDWQALYSDWIAMRQKVMAEELTINAAYNLLAAQLATVEKKLRLAKPHKAPKPVKAKPAPEPDAEEPARELFYERDLPGDMKFEHFSNINGFEKGWFTHHGITVGMGFRLRSKFYAIDDFQLTQLLKDQLDG